VSVDQIGIAILLLPIVLLIVGFILIELRHR